MRRYKKKSILSMRQAICFLILGLMAGTVFTFGTVYSNADVPRESCARIETEFLDDKKIYSKRSSYLKEIAIDCADGERYFINGVSIDQALLYEVEMLSEGDAVTLLIHPKSHRILEFTAGDRLILNFEDTIAKFEKENVGFIILGIFSYCFAVVGLYHIVEQKFFRKNKR